jgi:raffinose/stachyose/melibiose transport system permease protein
MATVTSVVHRARPARTIRVRARASNVARYVIALLVAVTIIVPIGFAILGGLRENGQILDRPFALPEDWFPHQYLEILGAGTFWRELANSTLIAVIATVVVVALSALAAFVFARIAFRGREVLYTLFTLGLLFPAAVAILPLYILIRTLGLLDNPLGVALPEAAFGLPLTIVILRPFFRSIPRELEDAAAIDGCSTFGFFWRILLPLSRPALATVAVLAVVGSWNAFLLPLLVVSSSDNWTLPLGVMNFATQYTADNGRILAFTSLSMIPALAFYLVAERQLVGGLTSGAVKG